MRGPPNPLTARVGIVSGSHAALEELGYVERETDRSDGRRKQLIVTARGYEMVRIGGAVFDDVRARCSAQLGREQLEVLESGLRALVGPGREAKLGTKAQAPRLPPIRAGMEKHHGATRA